MRKSERNIDWTMLNPHQADALRSYCNENQVRVRPGSPAAIRLYFEKVARTPVPAAVLAATVGEKVAPPISPAAKKLAVDCGLDLELIPGTGPSGKITTKDVSKFVADRIDAMQLVSEETVPKAKKPRRKRVAKRSAAKPRIKDETGAPSSNTEDMLDDLLGGAD